MTFTHLTVIGWHIALFTLFADLCSAMQEKSVISSLSVYTLKPHTKHHLAVSKHGEKTKQKTYANGKKSLKLSYI